MVELLQIAVKPFAFVWTVFHTMLESTGTMSIYLGMIMFAIATRVLVGPLVGSSLEAGSDTVAKRRANSKVKNGGKKGD